MKKRVLQITCFVVGFTFLGLAVLFWNTDSYRFNLRYSLWKQGWVDYKPRYVNFLTLDTDFRGDLIGRDLDEVEKLFPNLRSLSRANRYQESYSRHIQHRDDFKGSEHFWIGDSQWTIEFRNGRVKDVQIWKG